MKNDLPTEKPLQRGGKFLRRLYEFALVIPKKFKFAIQNYIDSKTKGLAGPIPKNRRWVVAKITVGEDFNDMVVQLTKETGLSEDMIAKKAERYLKEIAANTTYLVTPTWDLILSWVFTSIYEGLIVDMEGIAKIKEKLGKMPVIFAPSHKSHMDYFLMTYILYHQKIPLPYVCAGINLNFWPVGPIFRWSGGFFIRRTFEGNKLYASSLYLYLKYLMKEKAVMEFFIEGGRSRTGKLLPPRMGMLSLFTDTLRDGTCEDIAIVPTSITYQSVLEETSLVAEQKGGAKEKESLWDIFKIRKYLRAKYGKVHIQFADPISAKEYFEQNKETDKRSQVSGLASEITLGINRSVVVTPSSVVATSLMTHPEKAIRFENVEEYSSIALKYLRYKGCLISEAFAQDEEKAFREVMMNFVRSRFITRYQDEEETFYVINEGKRHLLNTYKNHSIHFLVSLACASAALISERMETSMTRLTQDYGFLRDLFRYEFTFSRRMDVADHIEKVMIFLEREGYVTRNDGVIKATDEGQRILPYFKEMLDCFLESYYVAWRGLRNRAGKAIEEEELVRALHQKGYLLHLKGAIRRTEAISKFNIQNAMRIFKDWGLVRGPKLIAISDDLNKFREVGEELQKYLPYIAIR